MIDGGKAACSVSGGEISGKAMLCGDWQETKVRACRSDTGGKGVREVRGESTGYGT